MNAIKNMAPTKKRGRPSKKPLRSYDKITKGCKVPSKKVYICSPIGCGVGSQIKARLYCRFAYDKGFDPICGYIYYPQFLDERNKDEKTAIVRFGLERMYEAKAVWVFGKRISPRMRAEIELAEDLKIPVKYFDEEMEER